MTIDNECVGCIINQSVKVADAIGADETLKNRLRTTVESMSKDFSFSKTPPEIAADVYEKMSEIADKKDLYDEVKELSTKKALSFIPFLKEKLFTCNDKLLTATKIAVAGNVIDLAAQVEFDLQEELEKIFHTEFSHNDFEAFAKVLQTAKNIVILGDNVGEHIFDYLFIETLQELYPKLTCTYMVRGNPIINDVTCKEAKEAGFEKLCNLVDSGVNTPGFVYERAAKEAQKLFDEADLVISKGMGNYECLSPSHRDNICFLLKVKCNVVANSLGKEVGDIVCKLV
ncbi:damage-control phosphatase ARMT1 family protein [Sulfurimonas hydrogeniphila]|uniref:damage-control phosphatase ARMT1 family protein n=1 Tax=Sulfurimonas hydrogeniphila TaxID=2509341 RepID=UPI00125F7371|nr:ARMT1-like domain-containing protein [Sulfurimonas hydrogeniphila]